MVVSILALTDGSNTPTDTSTAVEPPVEDQVVESDAADQVATAELQVDDRGEP